MASKVLLISANRCTRPDPVFPLGLTYLSGALRQAGHECLWLDCLADGERLGELLQSYRPDFVGISLRNIDDVLIRKQETFFESLVTLGARVREALPCPVILGGSGFSIFPQQLLALTGADFGIAGEGESGLLALIAALESGGDYRSIPGLVYRREGSIILNAPVPGPVRGEVATADRPASLTAHYLAHGAMLNVQTQRGCAHRCCYCTYPLIEGREHRRRPAELVAAEFEQLQRQGARYVFLVDSVFNSSPRHITEVCEALLRRGLKLPWGCFLRPQGLTAPLMRLMARAGLKHIEFGSDSFCNEVLAAYHKDLTFEDILQANELARQETIDCCHFLIAGGPGETYDTLEQTFENSQRLRDTAVMAVVGMRIYPGTQLYRRALAEGRIGLDTDLLQPTYYLAPGLEAEAVFGRLQAFARQAPHWIAGDPPPAFQQMIGRLRQRGVAGPLWSYFSMLQRLWPQHGPAVPETAGNPAVDV